MDFLAIMRAVYEHSLDGIVIADADTVIMDCNPTYAQLCGYTRDELIGKRTNIVRSGLTPESVFQEMWGALGTTGHWVGELINRRKDGSLWVSFLSITRVLGPDGEIRAYVGIARDLTDRKRLEEQLREKSTHLDALLDSIEAGVLMFDINGRCVVANRMMTEVRGVGQEALLGQSRSRLAERLSLIFREPGGLSPDSLTGERTLTTREERPRYFTEYWAPVTTSDGTVLGHLFTYRDVTREVEIDRMKSEFIATVSHELRTPMTSVKGALGLLLGGAAGPVSPPQQELLQIAQNNADRLIRLINDILDLSRIEAGRMELHRQPISVIETANAALQELEAFRLQRQIDLKIDLPPDLPEVMADPDRVGQVVINLVGNALKFTEPGGRVAVRARAQGDFVRFEVEDTGPGIPRDQLDRIFERFHRAGGATARKGGTGLGLAICRAIIQEHGGRIWAESELGKGSTFSFTLPVVPLAGLPEESAAPGAGRSAATSPAAAPNSSAGGGADQKPLPAPAEPAAAPAEAGLHRPTVLVCDDDADIVRLLTLALEAEGFRVLGTTDGEEAVALCRSQPVDCVTLDLLMPKIHGLEVARQLKEDPKTQHIPVVIISAYADQHESDLACLGVAGVVRKPIRPNDLLSAINSALEYPAGADQSPDILAVDDDPEMRRVVELILSGAGYRVRTAPDGQAALRAVSQRVPDLPGSHPGRTGLFGTRAHPACGQGPTATE